MKPNETLYGFRVTRVRTLDEIDATLCEMQHEKCGARLAFIDRADANKTFGICFKTLPEDDTGVFHIIEHSVLCGSKKFPVKEPFVDLLKSSLKTFLNAMTYNDKTVYPVASRNDKDFYNLVDVYMDAVLNPAALSDENVFRQEGWHYELSDDGELSYNGVVYNEMKGAYSSADNVADEELMKLLYPNSPYSRDSGGDPKHIPELTYEKFKEAHSRFYDPSSALIFLDGAVRLDEILPLLDSYLKDYQNTRMQFNMELGDYERGVRRTVKYEISPEEDEEGKCRVYLAGRTCSYNDKERGIALGILRSALAGTNEMPLKRVLLDSGLCDDVNLRINDGLYYGYYDLELCNVKRENVDTVIALVKETLTKAYKNGLDRERLSAIFNSTEFRNREKDFGSTPKGLVFGLSMLDTWLWDGDPADTLTVADTFAALREKMAEGYFEELLRECFLDSEPVELLLVPSRTLGEEREAEERALLASIKSKMSEAELNKTKRESETLKKWQAREDSPEALATLPTLELSDISAEPETVPTDKLEADGATVLLQKLPTSGICYAEAFFDASDLSGEELLLLPTLTAMFKNVKTAKSTPAELQNRVLSQLGGLSFNPISTSDVNGGAKAYVQISASALEENRDAITDLISEIIYTSELSDERELKNAVSQALIGAEDSFISGGHVQAIGRAAAYVSAPAVLEEYLSGYEQYLFLKTQSKSRETSRLAARLHSVADKIFRRERLTLAVTSSAPSEDFARSLISSLKDGGTRPEASHVEPLGKKNEGIAIPSQVSYASVASDVLLSEPLHGSHIVVRSLISYSHLWNTVRVQGGAYGAGLVFRKSGTVAFYSYRDPSPARTLGCYADSGSFLRELAENGEPLDKYIIGAFGDYDPLSTPRSAGVKAAVNALRGWTDDMERRFRSEMVSTSSEDLLAAARLLERLSEEGGVCVIGPKSALDSMNGTLKARLEL